MGTNRLQLVANSGTTDSFSEGGVPATTALVRIDPQRQRRRHRGHRRPGGPQTTVVTQKVYRHQLRPVITTGATTMNTVFTGQRDAKSA